jgi:hypothetical protein
VGCGTLWFNPAMGDVRGIMITEPGAIVKY